MKRAINVFSPSWEIEDSYGRIAHELAHGLESRGYHVNKFGDGAPEKQFIYPSFGGFFLGYPTLFKKFYEESWGAFAKMGPRVAITMFESTKLLEGWAEELNRCDAVIVPAQFLETVFRDNGVLSPISVHPLGVSDEFLKPVLRPKTKPLTFLAIGDRGARKAVDKVLLAYQNTFGNRQDVKLLVKTRKDSLLSRFRFSNANIEVIAQDLSNAEMAELYGRAHCMVFPSCGEGFGLPPREFAATGGISLVTNWGGTEDNLEKWAFPLQYEMATAWNDKPEWYGNLGEWANVSVASLGAIMQCVSEDYALFQRLNRNAAEFVAQNYSWSNFVEAAEAIWQKTVEVKYASAG